MFTINVLTLTCCLLALLQLLFVVTTTNAEQNILPADYKKCPLKGADFEECFKISLGSIVQAMINGIPSIGVPCLDPGYLNECVLRAHNKGSPVGLEIKFKDIKFTGLKNLKINNVKGTDLERGIIAFDAVLPEVTSRSKCDLNGKMLMLPIRGNGNVTINIYDSVMHCKWIGEKTMKDGKNYLKVTKTELGLTIPKGSVQFDSIMGANAALDKQLNKLFNDNFSLMFTEFHEAVDSIFIGVVHPNAVKFTDNVSLEEMVDM